MSVDVEFDVRSIEDPIGTGPNAPVSTRARAILRMTAHVGKICRAVSSTFTDAGVSARQWWMWVERPPSLRAMWRLSDYQPHRVHKGSPQAARVWRVMNYTERPMLFVLTVLAPGFLQPLLRWAFQRPTRRVGVYVVTALLVAGVTALVGAR